MQVQVMVFIVFCTSGSVVHEWVIHSDSIQSSTANKMTHLRLEPMLYNVNDESRVMVDLEDNFLDLLAMMESLAS